MDSSQATTEPVNPLTGDLTTIQIKAGRDTDDLREVQGRIVVPGLAITPSQRNDDKKPSRYLLTHVASGLAASGGYCGAHIQELAQTASESDIDWTAAQGAVIEAIKAAGDLPTQLFGCRCRDWCLGDGPEPPSYGVRCDTCHWQYDPEDDIDDGPLTFEDARRLGRDHECEPEINIAAPGSAGWAPEWRFDKDGRLRPASGPCANCGEEIEARRSFWQHKATRFVMCADGRSSAEPKPLSPATEE